MRSHHRLFAVFALLLAATLFDIRPGTAAPPVCTCWPDGLLGALGGLPDFTLESVCSKHPTSSNTLVPDVIPLPGAIGAGICEEVGVGIDELDWVACLAVFTPMVPVAVAAVAPAIEGGEAPLAFCELAGIGGVGGRDVFLELPQAWACINDIAALCRSLR